ncbi:hypothetical protein HGRIS_002967 [Hohenbuehelia grisea]|uniref:Uncharacterized protein n=1 Tax=Hohenbuehelia grisea TaxID=104357 RepID=A0ABR3JMM3_9AGAR
MYMHPSKVTIGGSGRANGDNDVDPFTSFDNATKDETGFAPTIPPKGSQSSMSLDPKVLAPGPKAVGNPQYSTWDKPEGDGVPSLTSTNNFINFCLSTSSPIHDRDGSSQMDPATLLPWELSRVRTGIRLQSSATL